MAAPAISASAVLLREYFLSYYQKVCNSRYTFCKSFTPTGTYLFLVVIFLIKTLKY